MLQRCLRNVFSVNLSGINNFCSVSKLKWLLLPQITFIKHRQMLTNVFIITMAQMNMYGVKEVTCSDKQRNVT